MSVSVRTRFAVANARLHRREKNEPAACAALARPYASFTWPRICCSPTTIESRLAETRNRWRTASTPPFTYRCSPACSERDGEEAARGRVAVRLDVDLDPVAGRDDERLARRRRVARSSPSAALSASPESATRSRTSMGALLCESPTRKTSRALTASPSRRAPSCRSRRRGA